MNNPITHYHFIESGQESPLHGYCRDLIRDSFADAGIPIAKETLDEAADLYAQKLNETACDLITKDIANLKEIFTKIDKEPL